MVFTQPTLLLSASGVRHPRPEQVELPAPVHRPLDHLQPVHLPFDWALAPLRLRRRPHGLKIGSPPVGEAHELGHLTALCIDEPLARPNRSSLSRVRRRLTSPHTRRARAE